MIRFYLMLDEEEEDVIDEINKLFKKYKLQIKKVMEQYDFR